MADSDGGIGIQFALDKAPWDDMNAELPLATKKATMYAVRATGRYLAKLAKAQCPVYSGSDPRAQAERGQLRKSIANAKSMTVGASSYELKVGPFGSTRKGTAVHRTDKGDLRGVPLYRAKINAMYGYMDSAVSAANSESAQGIYEAAYEVAWAKWTV